MKTSHHSKKALPAKNTAAKHRAATHAAAADVAAKSHAKEEAQAKRRVAIKSLGDAPPLPTDAPRAPRAFDAIVGREAFAQVEASLRAVTLDELQFPNSDSAASAMAAFSAVEFIREPSRKRAFDAMPERFLAKDLDVELESLAWSTWWLQTRAQSVSALANDVRVNPDIVARGTELRARMIRVLGYYFAEDQAMQTELADIRSGTGYQDLAVDLTRLEGHYRAHADVLAEDSKFYDPADAVSAREIANGILAQLRESMQSKDETIDLRNRSWTRLNQVYATLKAASDFIFRDDPRALAMFPPLRAVVASLTAKPRSAPVADPAPAPVPAPAPAPVAGTTDIAPAPPAGVPPVVTAAAVHDAIANGASTEASHGHG